jgi:hypothetical protein
VGRGSESSTRLSLYGTSVGTIAGHPRKFVPGTYDYRRAEDTMTAFTRYIGIDYSGAKTPTASLKGLRVYLAGNDQQPDEVLPPSSPRKYWTRRGVAEWLVERLAPRVTVVAASIGL